MHKVAVYGSLRKGMTLDHNLAGSTFLGVGLLDPIWRMRDLGSFPAIFPQLRSDVQIKAEVYEVDDGTLACLDWIEGHPNFYYRSQFNIDMDGEAVEVWIYYISSGQEGEFNGPIVTSGDWVEHYKEKRGYD